MKRLLGLLGFVALAIVITTAIVIYAMGYRPDLSKRTITATGVVSIKTEPQGAKVFVDGKAYNDTDVDIPNLSPGSHVVKITREGFSTWEKTIIVHKEKVNILELDLFRTTPTLRSATSFGIINPVLSPTNNRVFFQVKVKDQAGIWALSLNGNNFTSFFSKELNKLASDSKDLEFSTSTFEISPNGSQLLVKLPTNKYVLLETSRANDKPSTLSESQGQKTSEDWQDQRIKTTNNQIKSLGTLAESTSLGLQNISFSKDKSKFFGTRGDGQLVVFDSKRSVYSDLDDQTYILPVAKKYIWYPDNQHLLVLEGNAISVVDLDGDNKISLFTGTFEADFIAVWPDGSKVAMLQSFNKTPDSLPNIYAIELR